MISLNQKSGITIKTWWFDYIAHVRIRLAVLRRWPFLVLELAIPAALICLVSGYIALLVFLGLMALCLGAPLALPREKGVSKGNSYFIHANLFNQKICSVVALIFAVLISEAHNVPSLAIDIFSLFCVPAILTMLVITSWSPELDTRWQIVGLSEKPDGKLEGKNDD